MSNSSSRELGRSHSNQLASPEEIVQGVSALAERFPHGLPEDPNEFLSGIADLRKFLESLVVVINKFGSVGDWTMLWREVAALRIIEEVFQVSLGRIIVAVPNVGNYLRMVQGLDVEIHPIDVNMPGLISDITPDPSDKKANMKTSLDLLRNHPEMYEYAESVLNEILAATENDEDLLFIGNTISQLIARPVLGLMQDNKVMTLVTDVSGWAGINGLPTAIKGQAEKWPAPLKKALAPVIRVLLMGIMGNVFDSVSREVAQERLELDVKPSQPILNTFGMLRDISDMPQVLQTLRPISGKKVTNIPPEMVGMAGALSAEEIEFLEREDTKTVVISFGSMGKQSNAPVIESTLRIVAEAAAERGIQLFVIANTMTLDLTGLPNVFFTQGTDMPALAARKEIFGAIHHMGQGAVTTFTLAGNDIPQGGMPQVSDQYENMYYAAEGGGFLVTEMKNFDPKHAQTILESILKMEQMADDPEAKAKARAHKERLIARIEASRSEYQMALIILNMILERVDFNNAQEK